MQKRMANVIHMRWSGEARLLMGTRCGSRGGGSFSFPMRDESCIQNPVKHQSRNKSQHSETSGFEPSAQSPEQLMKKISTVAAAVNMTLRHLCIYSTINTTNQAIPTPAHPPRIDRPFDLIAISGLDSFFDSIPVQRPYSFVFLYLGRAARLIANAQLLQDLRSRRERKAIPRIDTVEYILKFRVGYYKGGA
ncbi:hypothetical protein P280DRAFT_77583 [Massarina eburnea CBS 473.64]|uniref:Uncharacterized protein n=1 Tax=Massarina eburnea CBS 473.64 TaxID=1395130 RepID=A0A6A6RS46_9PLEO|nr:hypothetical protein P280DRAFT_77583 [Massarina eburnea CBS 473.64]